MHLCVCRCICVCSDCTFQSRLMCMFCTVFSQRLHMDAHHLRTDSLGVYHLYKRLCEFRNVYIDDAHSRHAHDGCSTCMMCSLSCRFLLTIDDSVSSEASCFSSTSPEAWRRSLRSRHVICVFVIGHFHARKPVKLYFRTCF